MDAAGVEEFKKSAVSQWAFDGGELVRNGYRITKVRQSIHSSGLDSCVSSNLVRPLRPPRAEDLAPGSGRPDWRRCAPHQSRT